MSSTTMTIRLESEMKFRLDRLAEVTHRSKSYLAAEAINEYLKTQEWQLAEIKKGLAEADNGQLVDHNDILKLWEDKEE
ncbi:Ribbon-helix-helix protein, copG family [Legionella massiliensis]|uniref:Ribbon-helix-helix protein, copG family n=1 Tax=Legionella massiliensis TaxID=1034943 RepID=A0A078KYK8_9GAMM|nr:CopG family ribbon-helix-helix protein [Legionella massiliensis]CDZ79465.1 Ribbon-helix-helix protein, copG family [Legionella massiliensis]CEE15203.1 Ribbon-helix-helix protein, copG family [Legionella massiliensis]